MLQPYFIGYRPDEYCLHSGMFSLARACGAVIVQHDALYIRWMQISWKMGNGLRQWGIRYYGSAWNAMVPYWNESKILHALMKSKKPYIAQFVWGEFTAPKRVGPYRRRGARVVVSVHCSARRWDSVWLRPDGYANADQVVLTSESQRP